MTLNFPPLDYSLLFPELINFHMEKNPSVPVFVYANEHNDKLTEISFLEFGRAAHRIAHVLRPSRQGPDGEIVMLIATTDIMLHYTAFVGLILAGYVPFPVSPRNSPAAVVSLINKTGCKRIVTLDHTHKGLIDAINEELNATGVPEPTIYELPTLRYAFPKLGHEVASDPFTPYPVVRPDVDSPVFYLHSSGSTGFPKPIAHTHRLQIEWLSRAFLKQCAELPAPRRANAMALPAFHSFGIFMAVYGPVASLVAIVVYAPQTWNDPLAQPVIPTSDNMIKVLKRVDCNILKTVPTFLEQMSNSQEALGVLKKIDIIIFGGGPMPIKVGNKLCAAGVRISCGYGGTEFGGPIMIASQEDIADGDWMYMRVLDNLDIRWVPQEDNTYLLQFLATGRYLLAVENLPDVRGFGTSDIFEKHPTKNAWRMVGRVDDVIALITGEKAVPAPMENVMSSSPLIQGVTMFGRERNQVGVLIEPHPDYAIDVNNDNEVAKLRNEIWPIIEEANKPAPAFSRIFKEMILFTTIGKPMLRTAKATLQRKATLAAYDEEINALYETVEASSSSGGLADPSVWTNEGLAEWLLQHAHSITPGRDIDPRVDLFAQGFDSLSATYLRNRILGALRRSSDVLKIKAAAQVPSNVIFESPTIEQLGARIAALVSGNDAAPQVVAVVGEHEQAINAMIEKYSAGLNGPLGLPSTRPIVPAVVLLTGSTGSLGSSLLSELLRCPAVERVYAFNRASSAKSIEERQKSAFKDGGLPLDVLDSTKLVYVEAEASLDKCGLSTERYEEIKNSITMVIHNAWRLDFNLEISSFEDLVRGSRNLVDLALDSPQKESLRFLFTSSVSSAQSWDNTKGLFPEQVQLDSSAAVGRGYGEAKYVVERIIAASGLHATSLRIGQIVGGKETGAWSTSDWFPIIVKSSIALGALPEAAGVVSWLRGGDTTSAILETAFSKALPAALNLVNPRSASWANIISSVRRAILQQKGEDAYDSNLLPIVPFGDWFARLQDKAENASEDDLANIPAIKLLEFFRGLAHEDQAIRESTSSSATTEATGLAKFCTDEAQRICPTMVNMRAIGDAEADAWVRYWISKDVF